MHMCTYNGDLDQQCALDLGRDGQDLVHESGNIVRKGGEHDTHEEGRSASSNTPQSQ